MFREPGEPNRGWIGLTRREFTALVGSGAVGGVAGCSGDDGDATTTPTGTDTGVPDQYRTATAIGGQQRDPDGLSTKSVVEYQAEPKDGQRCSDCTFYVPDRNGDGAGACAIVEGTIDPSGWCVSYGPHGTDTPETTDTPGTVAGPVSIPGDASCPVCDMAPAEFPAWNAQLVHDDGARAYFDTAGCMAAYYAVLDEFAATDADVGGVWVTDYETGERIDGREAVYALETDPDRVDDPMGLNPAPFASRDDAEAHVDAVEHLSEGDLVGLDAFDRDLASQYRGQFLDES
jgi:nitrous oxide reductase accessory protein NosL